MKIITRKELMNLPAGTVYSYYEPCCFTGLYIKDSIPEPDYPDFVCSDLIGAVEHNSSDNFTEMCEKMERGESCPVDFEYAGREGLFDDKQLFAIYEKKDIVTLIDRLVKTL